MGYLVKLRYSCHTEIGILEWGKRRVDVLGMNMKRDLVAIEIKQSWADFISDKKYGEYFGACHRFYFCLPHDFGAEKLARAKTMVLPGTGIMVLEPNGFCKIIKSASRRTIEQDRVRYIVTKLAWRGGTGRHNSRRNRVYL